MQPFPARFAEAGPVRPTVPVTRLATPRRPAELRGLVGHPDAEHQGGEPGVPDVISVESTLSAPTGQIWTALADRTPALSGGRA